mmetsp:Transcript_8616/g.15581  ORF Transcript_8616/g.15581 Transcript_8616/m.15581 type:complete len:422 (-) Transcript_8616:1028-2293(-)
MMEMNAAISLVLAESQKAFASRLNKSHIVSLSDAVQCTLAESVYAPFSYPSVAVSLKDGYAVRSEYQVGNYPVVSYVHAGTDAATLPSLPLGAVCYIATGAPIPPGADAVVPVEHTVAVSENSIKIEKPASGPGADIRPAGSDFSKDQLIVEAGQVLYEAEIGLLASLGMSTVKVCTPPVIGVLSTGDEVVDVQSRGSADAKRIGVAFDSNRPMLLSASRALRASVLDFGIVPDSPEAVHDALAHAASACDVLITSGGVSMGKKDVLQSELSKLGTIHFGRVCMKPGKPLTFTTIPQKETGKVTLAFSLPGNAVSSFVCFHLVAAPAIRTLSGSLHPMAPTVHVSLTQDLKLDPERPEYHRAHLTWNAMKQCFDATSTGAQASSRLLSARGANALLILPAESGVLTAGTFVEAMLIHSELS